MVRLEGQDDEDYLALARRYLDSAEGDLLKLFASSPARQPVSRPA
jgi:hypothetical protein